MQNALWIHLLLWLSLSRYRHSRLGISCSAQVETEVSIPHLLAILVASSHYCIPPLWVILDQGVRAKAQVLWLKVVQLYKTNPASGIPVVTSLDTSISPQICLCHLLEVWSPASILQKTHHGVSFQGISSTVLSDAALDSQNFSDLLWLCPNVI